MSIDGASAGDSVDVEVTRADPEHALEPVPEEGWRGRRRWRCPACSFSRMASPRKRTPEQARVEVERHIESAH